jgi:exonuclease III
MMMMFNAEIWNVRGLNVDGKITAVSDTLKKYCPDTIALSETKKEDFSPGCLKSLANFHDFEWNWLPAIGTAGGILVGVNLGKFEIFSWYKKKYCVMVSLKNKTDKFIWNFVAVYGTAYEEHKQEFLDELSSLTLNNSLPIVFGGDFNLVRKSEDKNNGAINFKWTNKFNDWINAAGLMELQTSNRRFTWSNNQAVPIMASLDRILVSTCWEANFPATSVVALARPGSDHTPLLLSVGDKVFSNRPFRFEKWWLEIDGFTDMVSKSWNQPCPGTKAIDVWQYKQRRLRKHLRGWSININAEQKNKKKSLITEYDYLDIMSETQNLSKEEHSRMKHISAELNKIWYMEEISARQRARERYPRR